MTEKTPAEFQAEIANKAIELSMMSGSLFASGDLVGGLMAMTRARILAEWAEEMSKPPRIVIINT